MENRIKQRINVYLEKLKHDFMNEVIRKVDDTATIKDLESYISAYEQLELSKEDFQKRKRVKNVVPFYDRCKAKRATGEQCSRRRRTGCDFCGTHCKSQPHGIVTSEEPEISNVKKVTVWEQDINGIIYYIDDNKNVYDSTDIYNNKMNPRVIATWKRNTDGSYSIPDYE